jgi:four helix bundle protein
MAFRFEGLEIFELAIDLARVVYEITRGCPREEMFGLTANVRRAATSVALNIAEGAGRGTRREFSHFIDIASGSVFEVVAGLRLAERLGFVDAAHLHDAHGRAETLARKLSSFKRSLTISHMP